MNNSNDLALYAYSGVGSRESELKSKIEDLGGRIWIKKDNSLVPAELSALIVGELSGTEKLHAALATGIAILHIDYVHESHRAGRFLIENWQHYDLGHSRFEEMRAVHKFLIDPVEMRQKTASNGGVYKDWTVVVLMREPNSKRVYDHLLRLGGARVKQWTARHLLDMDHSKLSELTHIFSDHSLLLNPSFQEFLEKNISCISALRPPVLVNFYITKVLARKGSSRRDFCLLREDIINNQVKDSVERGKMLAFARQLREKEAQTELNKKFNGVGDPSLNQETSSPVYGMLVPSLTAPLRPRNRENRIRLVKEEDVRDEPTEQPSATVSPPVQDPSSINPPSPEYNNAAISPQLQDPFSINPPSPDYNNAAISPQLQDLDEPGQDESPVNMPNPATQELGTENTTRPALEPPASPSYEPEVDSLFPVRDTPLSPGKDDMKSPQRQSASASFDVVPSAAGLPPPTSVPIPTPVRPVPVPSPILSVPVQSVPVPVFSNTVNLRSPVSVPHVPPLPFRASSVRSVPVSVRSVPSSVRSVPSSVRSPVPVRSPIPDTFPVRSHAPVSTCSIPVPVCSVPGLDSVPNPVPDPDLLNLPLPVPTTYYSIDHQALSPTSSSPSPPPSVDRRGGGSSSGHPTSPLSAAAGVGSRRDASLVPSSQLPADSASCPHEAIPDRSRAERRRRGSRDAHSSRKDRHSADTSQSTRRGSRDHAPETKSINLSPGRRRRGSQDRHGSSRSRGSRDQQSVYPSQPLPRHSKGNLPAESISVSSRSEGPRRGSLDMDKDRHRTDPSKSTQRGSRELTHETRSVNSSPGRSRGSQDRHGSSRSRGPRDQQSVYRSQPHPRDSTAPKDRHLYQPPPLRLGRKEVSNVGFKGAACPSRKSPRGAARIAGATRRPRSGQDTLVSPELLEARAKIAQLQRELQQASAQGSQQRGDTQPPPGQKRRRERRNTQTDDEDVQMLLPACHKSSVEVEVLDVSEEDIEICEDDDVEVVALTSKSTHLGDKRNKFAAMKRARKGRN